MKITRKAIALLMAAVMVIGGAADLQAQKRKTGAKKRTTTTSTAAVKKVPDLTGNKFLCFMDFDYAGKTMQIESSITLKSDGTSWDFGYLDKEGEWSVTGNTLKIAADNLKINASSRDGGKIFSGKFQNGGNGAGDKCMLYNVTPDSNLTPKNIQTGLTGGKYLGYLTLYTAGDPEIGFPVTVKFTPDAKGNGGTYKVSGSHVIMTALGMLKGKYSFGEENLVMGTLNGGNEEFPYADNTGYFRIPLGPKNIPGTGRKTLILYLIRK